MAKAKKPAKKPAKKSPAKKAAPAKKKKKAAPAKKVAAKPAPKAKKKAAPAKKPPAPKKAAPAPKPAKVKMARPQVVTNPPADDVDEGWGDSQPPPAESAPVETRDDGEAAGGEAGVYADDDELA